MSIFFSQDKTTKPSLHDLFPKQSPDEILDKYIICFDLSKKIGGINTPKLIIYNDQDKYEIVTRHGRTQHEKEQTKMLIKTFMDLNHPHKMLPLNEDNLDKVLRKLRY